MIVQSLKIPVVGSGDVTSFETAKSALESGVAGYMIGRGALANPWIFSDIHRQFAGLEPLRRLPSDIPTLLLRYRELLLEHGSERAALGKLKQLTSQVTRLIHGTSQIRRELCTSHSLEQLVSGLTRWQAELLEGESRPPTTAGVHYPPYVNAPEHSLQDLS
jgi:tRNA-dihydrouridine synthase